MKVIKFYLSGLLLLAAQATLQAQSGSGGGFGYSINAGGSTITITNYTGPGGTVSIPATINGLAVVSIGFNAFNSLISLGSVTVPSGVTNIGSDAFEYCDSLVSVTLPASVKTIGSFAFSGCSRLTTATLATGLASIGTEAFGDCIMLAGITIPNSVTNLGQYSFYNSGLTNVTIPAGITNIAAGTFEECADLVSASVLGNVATLGESAFEDCDSLSTINFQGNAPTADSTVFEGDTGVTAYYMPGTMGWTAFHNSTGVTIAAIPTWSVQVTINPPGVGAQWRVDSNALQNSGATVINLPATSHSVSVRTVSGYQFINWTSNGVTLTTATNFSITLTTNLTLAANFLPLYNLSVSANPSNAGTLGGGGSFLPGTTNTVTAIPNTGYVFENWTEDGVIVSASSNYSLTLNASETLVANFLPPLSLTLTTTPVEGGVVNGGGTNFIAGTSTYLAAVANDGYVFVSWTGDATGTVNPLPVTVNSNLNIIANFAAAASNISLTIATNGAGGVTVSPKEDIRFLKAGASYTLKAAPAPGSGQVFAGWTGSVTTNKNPLTLSKVQSSMAMQANFVTNPFPPFVGTYNGLFSQTNGVITEDSAGMLKALKVTSNGTYSGTLLINGKSRGITGVFQTDDMATNSISIPDEDLEVVLALTSNGPLPQVTGAVSGNNWTANLIADRATNTLAPGEFTLLIPPSTNNSPAGAGYALVTNYIGTDKNPAAATARITGALADGVTFSQTVPVSQDGYVPIYANLYGGKGLLLGWINLNVTNTNAIALTGLAWIHPGGNNFKPYTNGFTNLILTNQIVISPWTNSAAALGSLANLTNLSILDTNVEVNVSPAGSITEAADESVNVSGSINRQTGLLTVTIGAGANKVTAHGAILLNNDSGGGYYLAPGKISEEFQLTP